MITAALEFIHARKWLMELILAAVVVAAVYAGCQHLIGVGVQRQKDDDAKAYAVAQRDADIKTAKAQERQDIAEKARAKSDSDLDEYRRTHPTHGVLCGKTTGNAMPGAANTDGSYAQAATGTGDVLALLPGDTGVGGQRNADIRGMLEALYANADQLSAVEREWQARY